MRALAAVAWSLFVLGCTAAADPPEETNAVASASTHLTPYTCVTTDAGVWNDGFIPQQSGHFTLEFAIQAYPAPMDAVIGLGNVKAAKFSDLGAIVRLNEQGQIDVRDGSTYRADKPFSYVGKDQWVSMDINIPTHRYSVSAWHDGAGDTTQIATNYAFRTEQQSLARISTVGQYIDSGSGSTQLCNAETAPPVCSHTLNTKQWYATSFEPRSGALTFDVNVDLTGSHIDGVLGLSPTTPRAFSDLAAMVRFNVDGYVDVRDGSTYRADRQVTYANGETMGLRFIVDTVQHRYSVLRLEYGGYVAIATNYAFRTEQANATTLRSMGAIVDNTASQGQIWTCDLTEMY